MPRKATVVTNCNIRAVPSKMAWLFAVLAKVVLAETPTCIPPIWCISIRVAFRTDLAIHWAPASASAVASAPAD